MATTPKPYVIKQVENPYILCPELRDSLNEWEWYIAKCHHWWWVAFDKKNQWVGYSGLGVFDRETAISGPAQVKELARGNGLQRAMYWPKERFTKQNGFKRIIAVTDVENIYSSNNLIACGFRMRKHWQGIDAERTICWEKTFK